MFQLKEKNFKIKKKYKFAGELEVLLQGGLRIRITGYTTAMLQNIFNLIQVNKINPK